MMKIIMVPGAGLEPAQDIIPRDFKSLASTNFATRATEAAKDITTAAKSQI